MGLGTLNNRSDGQTILDTFFNDIHGVLNGSFVGRNTSGVATANQDLGTAAIPWGSARITNLVINGSSLDTSQLTSPQNRIVSGKVRSTSNQPAYLTPTGSAATFTIAGSTTSLVVDINGTAVTLSSDLSSSATVAPGSNNTCAVNDSTAADQEDTKLWGEYGHRKESITVGSMGSEISALIGSYQAFSLNNGVTTEYFMAYVASSTSLTKCRRGYFYDSSLAPKNRIAFTNTDTITLLKAGYVFLEDDATTVEVSYTAPHYGQYQPSSPATGDYWYDTANTVWKRYDGSSFQSTDRILVGIVVSDATNCVGARSEYFYKEYSTENTIDADVQSTEIVEGVNLGARISVDGNVIEFRKTRVQWNITTDLAAAADMYNASEQASTVYYGYISDQGEPVLSDISPYWDDERGSPYHPHNPWRLAAMLYNDGSSNIVQAGGVAQNAKRSVSRADTGNGTGSTDTAIRRLTNQTYVHGGKIVRSSSAANGDIFTLYAPVRVLASFFDDSSGNDSAGISLNSTQLTTAITTITTADRRALSRWPATDGAGFGATEIDGKIGDQIRLHGTSSNNDTSARVTVEVVEQ